MIRQIVLFGVIAFIGFNGQTCSASDDVPWLKQIDERFHKGDIDYAQSELKKYVEKHPDSCRGWGLLGWTYERTDELQKAHECFDKSLEIDPKWDNAWVGKGAVYRQGGDNQKARESYLKAINIAPKNAEAFSSLLVLELKERNDEKAVEYGEKAWALRKNLANIPANVSVAYHYLGDFEKRDEFFQHAKRLKYANLETLQDIFDGKLSIR